ncbi:hypothetical protein DXG01_009771 [Tephrocybe rancida]|nr:hypothetical protein DXG01_009771 [Tephrocybe rancida]
MSTCWIQTVAYASKDKPLSRSQSPTGSKIISEPQANRVTASLRPGAGVPGNVPAGFAMELPSPAGNPPGHRANPVSKVKVTQQVGKLKIYKTTAMPASGQQGRKPVREDPAKVAEAAALEMKKKEQRKERLQTIHNEEEVIQRRKLEAQAKEEKRMKELKKKKAKAQAQTATVVDADEVAMEIDNQLLGKKKYETRTISADPSAIKVDAQPKPKHRSSKVTKSKEFIEDSEGSDASESSGAQVTAQVIKTHKTKHSKKMEVELEPDSELPSMQVDSEVAPKAKSSVPVNASESAEMDVDIAMDQMQAQGPTPTTDNQAEGSANGSKKSKKTKVGSQVTVKTVTVMRPAPREFPPPVPEIKNKALKKAHQLQEEAEKAKAQLAEAAGINKKFFDAIYQCKLGTALYKLASDNDGGHGPKLVTRKFNTRPALAKNVDILAKGMEYGAKVRNLENDNRITLIIRGSLLSRPLSEELGYIPWSAEAKASSDGAILGDGNHRRTVLTDVVLPQSFSIIKKARETLKNPKTTDRDRAEAKRLIEAAEIEINKWDWLAEVYDYDCIEKHPRANEILLYLSTNKEIYHIKEEGQNMVAMLLDQIATLDDEHARLALKSFTTNSLHAKQHAKLIMIMRDFSSIRSLAKLHTFDCWKDDKFFHHSNLYAQKDVSFFLQPLVEIAAHVFEALSSPDFDASTFKTNGPPPFSPGCDSKVLKSNYVKWRRWLVKSKLIRYDVLDGAFLQAVLQPYREHMTPILGDLGTEEGTKGNKHYTRIFNDEYLPALEAAVEDYVEQRLIQFAGDGEAIKILNNLVENVTTITIWQFHNHKFDRTAHFATPLPMMEQGLLMDVASALSPLKTMFPILLSSFEPLLPFLLTKRGDKAASTLAAVLQDLDLNITDSANDIARQTRLFHVGHVIWRYHDSLLLSMLDNKKPSYMRKGHEENPPPKPPSSKSAKAAGHGLSQTRVLMLDSVHIIKELLQRTWALASPKQRHHKNALHLNLDDIQTRDCLVRLQKNGCNTEVFKNIYKGTSFMWHQREELITGVNVTYGYWQTACYLYQALKCYTDYHPSWLVMENAQAALLEIQSLTQWPLCVDLPRLEEPNPTDIPGYLHGRDESAATLNSQLAKFAKLLSIEPFFSISKVVDNKKITSLTPQGKRIYDCLLTNAVEAMINHERRLAPDEPFYPMYTDEELNESHSRLEIPQLVSASTPDLMVYYKYRTPMEILALSTTKGSGLLEAQYAQAEAKQSKALQKRVDRINSRNSKAAKVLDQENSNDDDEEDGSVEGDFSQRIVKKNDINDEEEEDNDNVPPHLSAVGKGNEEEDEDESDVKDDNEPPRLSAAAKGKGRAIQEGKGNEEEDEDESDVKDDNEPPRLSAAAKGKGRAIQDASMFIDDEAEESSGEESVDDDEAEESSGEESVDENTGTPRLAEESSDSGFNVNQHALVGYGTAGSDREEEEESSVIVPFQEQTLEEELADLADEFPAPPPEALFDEPIGRPRLYRHHNRNDSEDALPRSFKDMAMEDNQVLISKPSLSQSAEDNRGPTLQSFNDMLKIRNQVLIGKRSRSHSTGPSSSSSDEDKSGPNCKRPRYTSMPPGNQLALGSTAYLDNAFSHEAMEED